MTQEKKLPVTEVVVTVVVTGANDRPLEAGFSAQHHVQVQAKDFDMEIRHGDGNDPTRQKWADWSSVAYQACLMAASADLDAFEIRFMLSRDEEHWVEVMIPSDFMKGGRIGGGPMLQVERRLERMGFECFGTSSMWTVHRPDPREGYARRGYFDAAQTIRLASSDTGLVDQTIRTFWGQHQQTSQYARYLTLRGERRGTMAKEAKEKAEEKASKQITTKALDGTEVPISPKQQEMLEAIKERSASGSPVGSDKEGADYPYLEGDTGRLDDPSSIACMKLATGEHPVVLRSKFGTRWHYFSKQADMDKAVKAAEKAAEDAKASKATKKSSKSDEGDGESAGAAKGTKPSAGSGSRLKKPSEK